MIIAHCDASVTNGVASVGWVVFCGNVKIFEGHKSFAKRMKSQEAEWEAVATTLQWLLAHAYKDVRIYTDNSFVVTSLTVGSRRTPEQRSKVMDLSKDFNSVEFFWVGSADNCAHSAAQKCLIV